MLQAGARHEPLIDSVLLAVLSRRIQGIITKMINTLFRTARSGVINNGRDFSCCILTADAELLDVGESLPMHVMIGTDIMAKSMVEFHPRLKRGDAFLHNSPYHGNTHPADLSVMVPVIDDDGVHRFTVLAKAHQADIGNSLPTTYMATARDVYEEGALIFAATKVQEDYSDIDDIIRMCMMRIRVPEQWRGDYLASLGAARIAERELLALATEVGWETVEAYAQAWFEYSEERMIAAIRKLPSGRVTGRSVHDPYPGTPPDGVPIKIAVDVDDAAATIEVDLTDNPDTLPCGLNLSVATATSAAMIGVFNAIGAAVPPNAGSFRRVQVRLRENCVVGIPRHPTSLSCATTNLTDRVANAVQRAISELGDGFGMAEAGYGQSGSAAVISGHDPRTGAPFVNQLMLGDPCGAASPTEDAWLIIGGTTAAGQWLMDSIESGESQYSLRIRERRLITDSEGAGTFRGAPAMRVEHGPVGCSMRSIYACDGTLNAPLGAYGGLGGGAAQHFKREQSGRLTVLPGYGDVTLEPGEHLVSVSCGGGGYGSPLARDPARVRKDVDEGYVSRARAEMVYGVVLDNRGNVDPAGTARRRAEPEGS